VLNNLPNLFDRNFAVGFFLPAVLIVFGIHLVLAVYELRPEWLIVGNLRFTDAVVAFGLVWVVAIFLMAINRSLVRLLEGYNWPDWLKDWAKHCFRKNAVPALTKQSKIEAARKRGRTATIPKDHGERLRLAVEHYPDDERFVLPTPFGNRYRAIEVYSRVAYGLDAVPAWPRLEAVMPKEFRESLASARSQLDFAVNVMFAGALILSVYVSIGIIRCNFPSSSWWLPALSVGVLLLARSISLSALSVFGSYVKAAFDLFRPELAQKLGLSLPLDVAKEREMWTEVSRLMIFRSAVAWERLEKFRAKPNSSKSRRRPKQRKPGRTQKRQSR